MANGVKDWRLVNLPDGSGKFRHFFRARRGVKQLDTVAAAVSRCDAILEALPAHEGSHAWRGVAEGTASSGDTTWAGKAAPRDLLLLALMKEERALRRYLASADGDPVRAFANAKGDVAYLDRLRSSDLLSFKPRAAFGKVLLPVVIVLLTAFSANVVGVRLQNQSLQNNRRFEVTLERLRDGQRLAGNLYVSVFDLRLRAASDESRGTLGRRAVAGLKESRKQLEQIRNLVAGHQSTDIDSALMSAAEGLNATIQCYEGQAQNADALCADKLTLEPFGELQDTITRALINYLEPN